MGGPPKQFVSVMFASKKTHHFCDSLACRFQFKHNVCGRRTYGEGVADAVEFIARKALEKSEKKAK